MRSILLALSLLTVTCCRLFAQQAHERTYPGQNNAIDWSVTYSTLDNTLWYAVLENSDIVLHHLDSGGNITASYRYTGLMPDEVRMEQSVNGNIYLTGRRTGGNVEYYLLAVNFVGAVMWSKEYSINSTMHYDHARILTLPNGNVMIIESVYGHLGYIEVDGNTGAVINSRQIREDTTIENKTPGFAADRHENGDFVFSGKRGSDITVVRTTSQGNIIWSAILGAFSYYHTKSVEACSNGTTLACGMEVNKPFVMLLDQNGGLMWYNLYDEFMVFYDVKQINANSFGVCGVTGMHDQFVYTRFDMNGNQIGTIRFADPGYQFEAYELKINYAGDIAIPFAYQGGWINKTAGLVLLEPGFNLNCNMTLDSLPLNTTAADPSIVVGPMYSINEPIMVSSISTPQNPAAATTVDLCVILNVEQSEPPELFSLQNTPAEQGQPVTFSLGDYRGEVAYSITDALGREVGRTVITYGGGLQPIDRSDQLAPGIYVFTVYIEDTAHSGKFVIR